MFSLLKSCIIINIINEDRMIVNPSMITSLIRYVTLLASPTKINKDLNFLLCSLCVCVCMCVCVCVTSNA